MDESAKRFVVACPHCAARLRVRSRDLGFERNCPKCTARFTLPDLHEAQRAERIQKAKAEFAFYCKLCSSTLYADPSQVGRKLTCPDCHAENVIPLAPKMPDQNLRNSLDLADEIRLKDDEAPENTEEFQVRCGKCDGVDYAKPSQIGKSILCPDCGAMMLVRPPPQKITTKVKLVDPKIELTDAVELTVTDNQSAARMERARLEIERREQELPKPPKRPFLDETYSFPFSLEILPRWIVVAVLGIIGFSILEYGRSCTSVVEMPIAMGCGVLLLFVGLITSFIWSGLSLTIVEFTGMGYSKAPHWPGFDIVDRLRAFFLFNAAMGFTLLPVTLISLILPREIPFFGIMAPIVGITGFPLVFLSMLDNNSMALPYSPLIFQSWWQQGKIWRKFYLATIPLVLLVAGGAWLSIYLQNEVMTWLYICTLTACSIVYVRLLGRLGWSLDQVVDIQNLGTEKAPEEVSVHEHAS